MMKNFLHLILLFLSMECLAQDNATDSLKTLLLTSKEDTNKVWLLDQLSEYYSWSFADTALLYAQKELQLSQKLNFESGKAYAMMDMGNAYTTLGNYPLALDFLFKSLALFRKLNDSSGIVYALGGLGFCYRDQQDYKQAVKIIREALLLHEGRLTLEVMLSSVYEKNNQLDSALFYAEKVYHLKKDMDGVLIILGSIHAKSGHNKLALEFYKKAISSETNGNFGNYILNAYNGIAKIYLSEGEADSAIYYSNQVLQKWGKTHPADMLPAATLLANIYESKNLKDSALKYLKMAISLNDILFNQQRTREAQSFAFDKQLQQQELVAQQQENDSKLRMYTLLAFMLILLLIAFFFFRSNRLKQKANVLLNEQKEKVESTLSELKSTQAQLIQSEKMASLGELTAGIAHEIQNPLNFVNNFSDVNKELVDELENELKNNNNEEAILIAKDIRDNEEKINHHGKRADAIVKGMLQHSKQTKGIKEPTDINALCDEYLRLSYHGMRAKDKNFNADFKTDFDNSINKINIVPQDIGRVLLNLYNNAFYAVSVKRKNLSGLEDLTGLVTVQTKKLTDKIEIKVSDNGNGIPQNIVDKIFQPFFTTKPTGEGTGLGLSLSYDIIKTHGGEIKVETKEGQGTTFIIQLPTTV